MDQGSTQAARAQAADQLPGAAAGRSNVRAAYRWVAVWMAVTDYAAFVVAFLLAYALRFGLTPNGFDFLAVILIAPPVWVLIFAGFKLYSVSRLAAAEEVRRVFYAVTAGVTGVVAVSYWTKAELSRIWVSLSWVLSLLLVLLARRIWHHLIWRRQARGDLTFRTLILGTNEEASHLAAVMRAGSVGFEAVGFVAIGNGRGDVEGLPVVGDVADIRRAIRETRADCVFVASSAIGTSDMRTVTKSARTEGVEVRVSANIPEMLSSRLAAQPLGGLMAFAIWPVRLTGFQAVAKRTFDLVVGLLLLVLSLPFWLVVALVIKSGSPGPVLYRQRRVGRSGREFTLLKFRTMVVGAEAMKGEVRGAEGPAGRLFKMRDDVRVTRAGRFLRRWSLDELPQLLNVLSGSMSLVGPRPPLPEEVAAYEPWHRDRLEVRPGITGLWQVSGRSELSFDDYVRLDLFYIENWSLAYDLYLLIKTVPAVVSGRGAF